MKTKLYRTSTTVNEINQGEVFFLNLRREWLTNYDADRAWKLILVTVVTEQ